MTNLIDEHWLPFRRHDGSVVHGPPSDVADPSLIDLALPRADFQGAAWHFLIALFQAAYAPASRKAWRELWEQAPTKDALSRNLSHYRSAFHLFGDNPRFMQEFGPMESARSTSIGSLLIEAPGEQGIKLNTDHFVKRGVGEELCPACAALALFTVQLTGPAGGKGYRVGIRGGGPLTTLVLPSEKEETLWRKLLLNLLTRDRYEYPDPSPDDWRIFPWLATTRTSEPRSSTLVTTPEDMHPLHVYWAMPNRFRLEEPDTQGGRCRICGQECDHVVRRLRVDNYGYNYDGAWRHPLTPYRFNPKKSQEPPISQKGQQGGLGYRHWEALVLKDEKQGGNLPARVVQDYLDTKFKSLRRLGKPVRQARLWIFGYDMKQNKPRGWYDTEMPLIFVDEAFRDRFLDWVHQFIEVARNSAWQVRQAVKEAWFSRPEQMSGDLSFIDHQFWETTTQDFYACLSEMATETENRDEHMPPHVARRWTRILGKTTLKVFDDFALSGDPGERSLKRIIAARNRLKSWPYRDKTMKHLRQQGKEGEAA